MDNGANVVAGWPGMVLRAEGLGLLAASVAGYAAIGGSWWVFAALFLVPDVFMLGYLRDRRLGAAVYNAGHTTLVPLALGAAGWAGGSTAAMGVALIWLGHIGFDRMLGYGLKYAAGFKASHLSAA